MKYPVSTEIDPLVEISRIQDEIDDLNRKQSKLKHQISEVKSESVLIKRQVAEKHNKIAKLKGGTLWITDHAIVRYLERIKGINLDEIKEEILPERKRSFIQEHNNTEVNMGDFLIIVDGGVVNTVYKKDEDVLRLHPLDHKIDLTNIP